MTISASRPHQELDRSGTTSTNLIFRQSVAGTVDLQIGVGVRPDEAELTGLSHFNMISEVSSWGRLKCSQCITIKYLQPYLPRSEAMDGGQISRTAQGSFGRCYEPGAWSLISEPLDGDTAALI